MKNNAETPTTNDSAAAVAEQGAHVASQTAAAKKAPTKKKVAPTGQKPAKKAKPTAAVPRKRAKAAKKASKTSKPAPPRAESKGGKILDLIRRPKGATLTEIMKATDWQAHSVRGFLSTADKKFALKIESAKNQAGERVYSIAKQ